MAIDPKNVKLRWDSIRKKSDCDLVLTPTSVADYLRKPESEIVRERIQETLTQLAIYRIEEGYFHSDGPDAPGDLATCEGLESFLIPAVEGALSFSSFLRDFKTTDESKQDFINAVAKDIDTLISKWVRSVFLGNPYSDAGQIRRTLYAKFQKEYEGKTINITETAAMACRVLIHLLTLKLNRPEERVFWEKLGKGLDDEKMFAALQKVTAFLVRAFQKGEGQSEEERIANAKTWAEIGSGWSWTDWEGLPPMLFFTASAVDAFAELDLYLIRPAAAGEWNDGTEDQKKLLDFYIQNEESLMNFQLCVEMARRWVQSQVLPYLSVGYGQYKEQVYPEQALNFNESPEGFDLYKDDLLRVGLQYPPMIFYNNLYVLQILLWSWGDWDDSGEVYDEDAKNRINRALAQLIYNYDRVPVIKEVLSRFPYEFLLPGKNFFVPDVEQRCRYLDSGFLPLLTRLLVLFVLYGVGDRNLLEPVIQNLYIDLLLNRNRKSIRYSALWSSDNIEMFSTQRAIQAFTFYFAYTRGKEQVTG